MVARYLHPEPRLRLGHCSPAQGGDIGDRLERRPCRWAGTGLREHPVRAGYRRGGDAHSSRHVGAVLAAGRDPVREALAGGDDYELLFTVAGETMGPLRAVERLIGGLKLTRIGIVTRTPGVAIIHADGRREPVTGGYEHFVS